MNVKELRIGNFIQDRDKKKAVVEGLCNEDGIRAFSGMVTGLPLQPIPITDKWLLKLGFEEHKSLLINTFSISIGHCKQLSLSWCNDKGKGEYYGYIREWEGDIKSGDTDLVCFSRDINYVHQLQNLYFAITGEELIK